MEFILDIAKHTRLNFVKLLDALTIEQLNFIPRGYNNNIAWNFAHIVAAQQTVCYIRGNVAPRIPPQCVTKYQKDTVPQGFISNEELNFYKEKAFTLLDDLQADITAGLFNNYEPVKTVFGVTLTDIDAAVAYIVTHDNLHLGYAIALRRAVLHQMNDTGAKISS